MLYNVGMELDLNNFVDPDTYVNWHRAEDPGQNPRWESKCGVIIQQLQSPGQEYWGAHWSDDSDKTYQPSLKGNYYTTFAIAKRRIEKAYFILHPEENAPAY